LFYHESSHQFSRPFDVLGTSFKSFLLPHVVHSDLSTAQERDLEYSMSAIHELWKSKLSSPTALQVDLNPAQRALTKKDWDVSEQSFITLGKGNPRDVALCLIDRASRRNEGRFPVKSSPSEMCCNVWYSNEAKVFS